APGLGGTAVRRLHDPAAPARADDVPVLVRGQPLRPNSDQPRKLARLLIVAPERTVRRQPRRAEKDDRVAHAQAAKPLERFEVLRQDAQRPRLLAREERLNEIGKWVAGTI